nr:MAG TPA: hypothetical protein [Caudoviricetes sp.]
MNYYFYLWGYLNSLRCCKSTKILAITKLLN